MNHDLDKLLEALAASPFRRRQQLDQHDAAYLMSKGVPVVLQHARQFIQQRLAEASPRDDGRQTPMRGHPAFVAQHATATCCRVCLEKWHDIPKGEVLTAQQVDYIVQVLQRWLTDAQRSIGARPAPNKQQLSLFDDA